ncbi:DUF3515 domain-containing protein [Embleya sp. NBC_00896]|uniref:DUF3515 domain-containing protein n=1 Tax=Embleya sp. NBC_00896 TaxID=2975961 RepID=UPI003866467B|nr:DUF3515 domain-containing protein [Embleya sp. NBC_00896]
MPLTRLLALGLPVAVLLAAGCSGDSGELNVAMPTPPPGAAGEACRALHDALPAKVMDGGRRELTHDSVLAAAWGDPAIVLRCGVELPASMRVTDPSKVGSEPNDSVVVNGVLWAFSKFDGGVRFTTVYREANVELTVPKKFAEPAAPLVDVADAVTRTVPVTLDVSNA